MFQRRHLLVVGILVLHAVVSAAQDPPSVPEQSPQSLAPVASAPQPDEHPSHIAADPIAPAVTRENLQTSERFWPYTVELESAWKPSGASHEIPRASRGVLVRVDSAKSARVDFGRHGLFDVPVDKTDIVERANRIRLGEESKPLPNFVEAIGPRLVDSAGDKMGYVPLPKTYASDGFLCVFADSSAASFPDLVKALAPLQERTDVMTIFFPQGRLLDGVVREKLRSLDWLVAFLPQHLSEPYTRTLSGDGATLPRVSLQTREGRLLFAQEWKPGTIAALRSAIDAEFDSSAAAAKTAGGAHQKL